MKTYSSKKPILEDMFELVILKVGTAARVTERPPQAQLQPAYSLPVHQFATVGNRPPAPLAPAASSKLHASIHNIISAHAPIVRRPPPPTKSPRVSQFPLRFRRSLWTVERGV